VRNAQERRSAIFLNAILAKQLVFLRAHHFKLRK